MVAPAPTSEPPAHNGADSTPRRTGLVKVAPVVAVVGLVVALIGVGLVLRPLSTPTQDCGTALTFLLDGEPNQFVNPNNPPEGVTPEQAQANNEHPCQERAANQARPAALMVTVGTLAALIAAITESTARYAGRRRQIRMIRGR